MAPVRLPSGDRAWLVTSYADNLKVFSDQRFSRRAAAQDGAPRARNIPLDANSLTTMDPPEHTRLRRALGGAFSPRRLDVLRERIGAVTRALLSEASGSSPADLVAGLAQPLALTVICDLLGLPEQERARFREWTESYLSFGPEHATRAAEAAQDLDSYFASLIERREEQPSEDVFGALVAAHADQRLSHAELRTFATTLLVAGYETVAAQIAGSLRVLLEEPASWSRLCDGDRLREPVVEELLRFVPIAMTGGTIRVAVEDVELSGTVIRAGEAVLPSTTSANRDAKVYTDPDRFDPDRFDPARSGAGGPGADGAAATPQILGDPVHPDRPAPAAAPAARTPWAHLAFGHGPHRCMGAHLARMQIGIALGTLLNRYPGVRPAVPLGELEWNTAKPIRCPKSLPVTW
ncbi:cytochrome P450 [Streptomyces albus subsp. chlorinus]|uniref:cytochrome P450 n=1 Tax=Streptomyces albus TaxID=1888 RepID=UPI00156E3174|nr:cytochrome P450 [Streptomyces albus subsp. chlorinus]